MESAQGGSGRPRSQELAVAGGRGRLAVAQLAQPGVARFAMGRAIDGGSDRRQGDADVAGDAGIRAPLRLGWGPLRQRVDPYQAVLGREQGRIAKVEAEVKRGAEQDHDVSPAQGGAPGAAERALMVGREQPATEAVGVDRQPRFLGELAEGGLAPVPVGAGTGEDDRVLGAVDGGSHLLHRLGRPAALAGAASGHWARQAPRSSNASRPAASACRRDQKPVVEARQAS